MTSFGKPAPFGKFYKGRASDTPWNHSLNWKNRCKLEKEEMKAREAKNREIHDKRMAELRERNKQLAATRFGVTGALIANPGALEEALATGRSDTSWMDRTARSARSTARSGAGSARSAASGRSSQRSAVTGRSVGGRSVVTTASERAALEELKERYDRENAKRARAEAKVAELATVLETLKQDLTARK